MQESERESQPTRPPAPGISQRSIFIPAVAALTVVCSRCTEASLKSVNMCTSFKAC